LPQKKFSFVEPIQGTKAWVPAESEDPFDWWMQCPECKSGHYFDEWEVGGLDPADAEDDDPWKTMECAVMCPRCWAITEANWIKTGQPYWGGDCE
jgi:hypothetical protein